MFWAASEPIRDRLRQAVVGRARRARFLLGALLVAAGTFVGVLLGVFLVVSSAALAQEPPLVVPKGGVLKPIEAITAGDWVFYPGVRAYSLYSDNLFQSPISPISVWGFGLTPSMIAEWSNGIHDTTIYGSANRIDYPTRNDLNVLDYNTGLAQKYLPLPDLLFRMQGDYAHHTYATLNNAIPGTIGAPGTITLPNGDIILPNGTIINSAGLTIGHTSPPVSATNPTTLVNPSNQVSAVASIEKILNRGYIGVSGTLSRTEYQNTTLSPDFTAKLLSGRASFWLGPLVYAYSDAAFSSQTDALNTTTTAYRAVGGLGTRQIGFFRASGYFGHQGSNTQSASVGSGSAGGDVYGARLAYYPAPNWALSAGVDETINNAAQGTTSNLALNLPPSATPTPLVVTIGTSSRVTSYSLQSAYQISERWSSGAQLGLAHAEFANQPAQDAWLADLTLGYQVWQNFTLAWEYQYSAIVSDAPLTNSRRNFVNMSADYKF
jgi:hypothetical protein